MKIYNCEYCRVMFASEGDLRAHLDKFGEEVHWKEVFYGGFQVTTRRKLSEVERLEKLILWRENWGSSGRLVKGVSLPLKREGSL